MQMIKIKRFTNTANKEFVSIIDQLIINKCQKKKKKKQHQL